MGRQAQRVSPTEAMPTTIILVHMGNFGVEQEYNFINGSIRYFEKRLKNSFDYTLIDNIGNGSIRFSYNRPALDITGYTNGAKTLKPGDAIYIEEPIWFVKIYYIENSTVELILKSDKDI